MEIENQNQNQNKKYPIIISDIDGVVLEKKSPLPGGKQAIEFLQKQQNLPFMFMTNRTGVPESQLAVTLNTAHQIDNSCLVDKDQVIMSHSPMIDIFKQYKDQTILYVTRERGVQDHDEFMNYLGVTNFITSQEYCDMYPFLVPLSHQNRQDQQTVIEKVHKRTGISIEKLKEGPVQISAIFLMLLPTIWEDNFQVITDLLSSENGIISDKFQNKGKGRKHIPVYASFNDLTFKNEMALPRMIMGSFTQALKQIYQKLYDDELEIIVCGKPEKRIFEYAINHAVKDKAFQKKHNIHIENENQLSNKYMIGDNPESDIQGANNAGWVSILVRTGVFQGKDNDEQYPAKHVVDNFTEAVKLICKLENIECQL